MIKGIKVQEKLCFVYSKYALMVQPKISRFFKRPQTDCSPSSTHSRPSVSASNPLSSQKRSRDITDDDVIVLEVNSDHGATGVFSDDCTSTNHHEDNDEAASLALARQLIEEDRRAEEATGSQMKRTQVRDRTSLNQH